MSWNRNRSERSRPNHLDSASGLDADPFPVAGHTRGYALRLLEPNVAPCRSANALQSGIGGALHAHAAALDHLLLFGLPEYRIPAVAAVGANRIYGRHR